MIQTWLKVPDMNHEQWLSWRREGIGGSDAPSVMGVGFDTPFELWEQKVLGKQKKDNSRMKYGRDTEDSSRREFEDLMGLRMIPMRIQNTKEAWLRASLDGIDLHGDKIVEIKKANRDDHKTALNNQIPEKYYPQCQHILKVTGKAGMYYFSSPADGSPGKIVEVARDDQYIDQLLTPKEKEFWEQVTSKKAPALTERDFMDMENNKIWLKISEEWKETINSLELMENRETQLRHELIALSKNHNARGNNLSLCKSIVEGRIDYKKAIEDYLDNMRAHYPEVDFRPIPLEPYRKASFVKWTVRDIG